MLPSSGFSGINANFFPWIMSWICNNKNINDQSGHLDQAMRFISIVDGTILRKYPTSAKHYLAKEYGAPFKVVSRVINDQITDQDVSYMFKLGHIILLVLFCV